jgi:hypothetical protein
MEALCDVAHFRADDPDELVLASLACPICLRGDSVSWDASIDGYDPSAECSCERCEEHWRVYLTPEQALRIGFLGTPTL